MKISCPKARRGLQLFATMKLDFETMASNEILCCLISRFLLIIRNYIQLSAMRLYCNRLVRWKRELSFPYSILEKLAYARDYRPNSPIVTSPPDFTCLKQLQFFMQRCNIKWFILITFYVFFLLFLCRFVTWLRNAHVHHNSRWSVYPRANIVLATRKFWSSFG